MPRKQTNRSGRLWAMLLLCGLVLVASAVGLWLWRGRQPGKVAPSPADRPATAAPAAPSENIVEKTPPVVIGKQAIETRPDVKELMADRKARFGIDKGVDFIAAPDEAIEVGGTTVPMSEILDKIRIERGEIIERDIAGRRTRDQIRSELDRLETALRDARQRAQTSDPAGRSRIEAEIDDLLSRKERLLRELESTAQVPDPDQPVELYGIYVVRPNDNIWNIHFNFLKDLFRHKGITLSPLADEPTAGGRSSGVGKLLKFSENMVAIYNVREHRLEADLDLIIPDSKVVVFNFSQVFGMLDQIDYRNIDHIQFDGETIWIPALQ